MDLQTKVVEKKCVGVASPSLCPTLLIKKGGIQGKARAGDPVNGALNTQSTTNGV